MNILNIINLHCIKTINMLSSTSNVKGKFVKVIKPHGVQSASINLRKFHFLDYSRIFKKWVLRMTRNSYFPLVLIFINSGQVQCTTDLYFFP